MLLVFQSKLINEYGIDATEHIELHVYIRNVAAVYKGYDCLDCDVTGFIRRQNNSSSHGACWGPLFCQRWTEYIFLFSWILWLLWRRSLPEGARVLFHFQFRRGRMWSAACGFSKDTVCVWQEFWNTPGQRDRASSPLCASRSIGIGTVKREMVSLLLKDFLLKYWGCCLFPLRIISALKNIPKLSLFLLVFQFSNCTSIMLHLFCCWFQCYCVIFNIPLMYYCYFQLFPWKERLHSFRILRTLQNVLILESNLQLLLVCLNFDWMSLIFAAITFALSFYFFKISILGQGNMHVFLFVFFLFYMY